MTAAAVLGVQGAQSPSNRGRGIARYITEHTGALARLAPGRLAAVHYDPELPAAPFLDGSSPLPRAIDGKDQPPELDLYHVMSPFEETPVDRIWPPWAQGPATALVVTLYDLIPLIYGRAYLADAWLDTYYRARLEMLRRADAVLAISAATRNDALRLLGLPETQVHVIGAGCSDRFAPAPSEMRPSMPGLRKGFLLYVGGLDARKNVARLLIAYSRLEPRIRAAAQLVVACRPEPHQASALRRQARRLGVGADVLLTGFVSEQLLLDLYRSCRALVLPSEYEGFGLPALEAMRCGAAVVVSDIPPLRELVPDAEARFDPASMPAIEAVLRRLFDDSEFLDRRRARAATLAAPHTWERVAERTLEAYEAAVRLRIPTNRSRKAS